MAICLIVCIYVCWASTAEIKTERHVSVLKKRDVCFFAWRWAPHCQHAEAGSILLGDKWPCSPISSHKKKRMVLAHRFDTQVWHTGLAGCCLFFLLSLSLYIEFSVPVDIWDLRSFEKICQDTQHSCQLSIAQGAALPQNEHRNFNSRDSATRRKNDGTNGTQRLHTCGGNKLKLVQNPPTPLAAGGARQRRHYKGQDMEAEGQRQEQEARNEQQEKGKRKKQTKEESKPNHAEAGPRGS